MERHPTVKEDGEMTAALSDPGTYARSELINQHLDALVSYLRDRGGETSLRELLDDFEPSVAIADSHLSVILDRAMSRGMLDISGLDSVVRLVADPDQR